MNPSKPRKQYTPEFKAQAIELLAIGRPVAELAEELCVSANLLYSLKSISQSSRVGSEGGRAVGEGAREPVEIGDESPVTPDEIVLEGRTICVLSQTDSVKDRLAGYIHWATRANFDQAILICRRQRERVDLAYVKRWCANEGGADAYAELARSLEENERASGEEALRKNR